MALFVVAYDIRETDNSDPIRKALGALDSAHTQESVWYVDYNGTAKALYDHLRLHVDDRDRLMVVEFTKKPIYQQAMAKTKAWLDKKLGS